MLYVLVLSVAGELPLGFSKSGEFLKVNMPEKPAKLLEGVIISKYAASVPPRVNRIWALSGVVSVAKKVATLVAADWFSAKGLEVGGFWKTGGVSPVIRL